MKRTHSPAAPDAQKRSKSSLAWLGLSLQQLKQLSSSECWHAAKQLVAESSVHISTYAEDDQLDCVVLTGHVAASENAAAFPHMRSIPELATPQPVSVQLALHPSTGQLLDADTSCCPGGFQPVLGSFCPYAVAALLQVAKQAQTPSQGSMQPMEGLHAWEGSSLADVLRSQGQLAPGSSSSNSGSRGGQTDPQQQQQQQTLHRVHDALIAQPTCFTSGLGLEAWQFEECVTATAKVHVASQRNTGVYPQYNSSRSNFDADKLALVDDAGEDLASHPWFQNVQQSAMLHQVVMEQPAEPNPATAAAGAAAAAAGDADGLPLGIRRTLLRAGIPIVGVRDIPVEMLRNLTEARGLKVPGSAAGDAAAAAEAAATAAAAKHVAVDVARKRLLEKAVKQWLTTYGGEELHGWQTRPKVINDAFDLLVGSDSSPGRPLSALVLLLRSLWEYMHHRGLGRLLAKPLKLLLALRSVLLVGSYPLWVRKAVCCQLELWERGLLWQHAATPLDSSGGHVGLVHLLRVGKEIHQLCLHHWDEPHLSTLLLEAFAEQHSEGGIAGSSSSAAAAAGSSGSSGVAAWAAEPSSLLQLRLQALDAMGASAAYLELAMAGGAWREAINRLLKSKERSQLLKAVKLLTRHITSLPERLKYMSQIVQLESLGVPERLEVTARLLLDLREQLHPVQHPVKVAGRASARFSSAPSVAGHMWKVAFYSMYENPAGAANNAAEPGGNRLTTAATVSQQHREHVELQQAWSKFLKLFLQTAAEALFKSAEESIKSHKNHLRDEGLLDDSDPAAGAPLSPEESAAAAAAAVARRQEEAERKARETRVTRFFCPSCNRVHDHEDPASPFSEPPVLTPQPGDPDWKLLDIDDVLFSGAGGTTMGSIPNEAITGRLTSRTPAGYIKEQTVIDAYKKVVPVEFPQLLSLCGLDALCISSIATKLMEDFDAGGKLDTSLGIDPLRELLSHPVVEMGPGPVRLQAAVEAVVYTSAMTPLFIAADGSSGWSVDSFYRELVWALLAVGQRSLALLVSRARYKVAPSVKAAGELLEVSIGCGPEAQAAAVDLILGKGCVRPLLPEDDPVIKELEGKATASTAAAAERRSITPPAGLSAAELQMLIRREADGLGLGVYVHPDLRDPDEYYSEEESDYDSDMDPYDLDHALGLYGGPPPWMAPAGLRAAARRELLAAEAIADATARIAPLLPGAAAAAAERGMADAREGSPEARDDDAMSISSSGDDSEVISISSDTDSMDGDGPEGGSGRVTLTAAEAEAAAVAAEAAAAAADADYKSRLSDAVAAAEEVMQGADAGPMQAARNAMAGAKDRQQQTAKLAAKLRRAADKAAGRAPKRRRSGDAPGTAAASGDHNAAGGSSAAAIAAAAAGTSAAGTSAAAAAGRGSQGEGSHPHHHPLGSEQPEASDGLGSFDTRELLGSDAAAVLQLKDTASSRGPAEAAVAASAAAPAPAAAAAAAAGEGGRRARHMDPDLYDEDDEPYYGRANRPVRNLNPAQLTPRPSRRPSKRRAAAAAAAAGSSRAAAGGGSGGGGGDDDPHGDGGPSHGSKSHKGGRKHHHRPNSRNRRSGSLESTADPQQQALVSELFGVSPDSHSHPMRTLRVHIHRLAGLQLWSVTKYAAGRGADKQQLQRLGMAAWLSDGNTSGNSSSGQMLRMSEALRWSPVASDQAGWLEATQQLKTVVNTHLQAPPNEPYGGVSTSGRSWSGLPCGSWDSFAAQERYPATYNASRHDTPDANLAWLMAVLADPSNSSNGSRTQPSQQQQQQQQQQQSDWPNNIDQILATSKAVLEVMLGDKKDKAAAAAAYLPIPYQGALTGYFYTPVGPRGEGYYQVSALSPNASAAAAAAGGSSGGDAGAGPSTAAAAGAGSSGGGGTPGGSTAAADEPEVDCVTDVLQKLAHLSKGIRFGLPMLQLCHALMEAGCRDPCLALLPQALLPAGGTILSLQLHSSLVTDMQELLPLVAKHGDSSLRVGAAMSSMLVTRRALPAALISQPEVLSGVMSWWLGLASILYLKPDEWPAASSYAFIRDYFATNYSTPHVSGVSNWQQLQRMLVSSILTSLGGCSGSRSSILAGPISSSSSSSNADVMAPAEGYQLLLQCEAVKSAHWAFRLYLARLCHQMRLAPTWPELSALLCPALSAAVAEHVSGWGPDCKEPLTDMKAWKEQRSARQLPGSSSRARDWVAETLEWLATEVLTGQDSSHAGGVSFTSARMGTVPGAAAGADEQSVSAFLGAEAQTSPEHKERLRRDFVDMLAATLSGWYGPELLLLASAVRPLHLPTFTDASISSFRTSKSAAAAAAAAAAALAAAQATFKEQQQEQLTALFTLMQAALLPRVGRADELSTASCVRRGQYRSELRVLMGDKALLAVLPSELLRCLALTYWQQEATPEGFLTANEVLLRLEGAAAAQTLALPGSTTTAGAAAGSSDGGSNASSSGLLGGLNSLAAGLRSFVPGAQGAQGVDEGAGMPQVHALLLEQLDLVPSKGGIEAAGLRFMQLQRHAAKGDHAAALESIFSGDSSSGGGGGSSGAGDANLSSHMEVVDAVLRLAADASMSNEALRSLMCCTAYRAIAGLDSAAACSDSGAGPLLLAPLGVDMQAHVLKLCIWRLIRAIQQRPPSIELRRSLGPSFVSSRNPGSDMAYNRNNPPLLPSYLTQEVISKWATRTPLGSLAGYCTELGLVQGGALSPDGLARVLCAHLEQQELALLWAIQRLAALQTGPQLESSITGLISSTERANLERLPLLMTRMGEVVKHDRKMMWAYAAIRHTVVAEKITRYIRRNANDVPTLQRYLAKSTIAEIQSYKIQSMPWASWEVGTKAAQAQELAEWLYWLQVTWPNERAAAGATREAPSIYTSGRYY